MRAVGLRAPAVLHSAVPLPAAQERIIIIRFGVSSFGPNHYVAYSYLLTAQRDALLSARKIFGSTAAICAGAYYYLVTSAQPLSLLPDSCQSDTFFFALVTGQRRSLDLKLSDTRFYEPRIRDTLLSARKTCCQLRRSDASAHIRQSSTYKSVKHR